MFRVALWLARGGVRVGGSRPHTVRFPELSLFTVRGVIHGSWCDWVATKSWSLPFAVLLTGLCAGIESAHHIFVTARVHSAPLRALRAMPVDTRKTTYASGWGTQPASRYACVSGARPPFIPK